jgi:hypothetical protein
VPAARQGTPAGIAAAVRLPVNGSGVYINGRMIAAGGETER